MQKEIVINSTPQKLQVDQLVTYQLVCKEKDRVIFLQTSDIPPKIDDEGKVNKKNAIIFRSPMSQKFWRTRKTNVWVWTGGNADQKATVMYYKLSKDKQPRETYLKGE